MSTDSHLYRLLDRWRQSCQCGQPLSMEELCRDCPELREQVEQRLAAELANTLTSVPPIRRVEPDDATIPPTLADVPPAPSMTSMGTPVVQGYDIECELARGGMGVVYRARQLPLNRVVALKMILSGVYASPEERLRFLSEAKVIAAISHPGIVQLHDFGTHGGTPYFAMEYCHGGTLARRLDGKPLPPRESARLVEQIVRAVQAAHEKGIIHRDLKPSNVLLSHPSPQPPPRSGEGEKAAAGSPLSASGRGAGGEGLRSAIPKITDFGLARNMFGGSGLTRTGMPLGTPSYMAPEQAMGDKHIGPAADIYSLGAILYECLTGRPPFNAATAMETLEQVCSQEPVTPRSLQPSVPRDLETICSKALQKEPGKRYLGAAELAEDLRRWQAGEPIHARPVGPFGRAVKWVRRRPLLAGMATAMMLVLVSGTAISTYFAIDAREQKRTADTNAELTREALAEVEENLALGLLRALGHYEDKKELNPVELDALEELASLPHERDRVRLVFFENALHCEARAEQLERRLEESVTAAVGLRADLREKTLLVAGDRLRDTSGHRPIRVAAARLVAGLKSDDPRLAREAAGMLIEEMGRLNRPESLQAVARSLRSIAPRIAPEDSAGLGKQIVVRTPRITDTEALRILAETFVALTRRLPPAQASQQVFALGKQVAERASNAIDSEDSDELLGLSQVLAVLASVISSPEAAPLAGQIAGVGGKTTDLPTLLAFSRAFSVLANKLAPEEARRQAALLGKQLDVLARRATGPQALRILSQVLAALAEWLPPEEAKRLAAALDRQVAGLAGKSSEPEDLRALAGAFAALVRWLSHDQATSQATVLARQVATAAESAEPRSLGALSEAFAAVADQLPEAAATARAAALERRVDRSDGANSEELFTQAQSLVALARRLDHEKVKRTAAALAPRLARTIHRQRDNRDMPAVFEKLCELLPPEQLVALLKQPGCVEPGPMIIVRCLGRAYQRDFRDVWDMVEYVRSQGKEIDCFAPLQRDKLSH
jgi:uncharacterized protein (DUF2267 family)